MQGKMYGVSRVPLLSDSNRRIIDTNGPSKRVYQVWRGSNLPTPIHKWNLLGLPKDTQVFIKNLAGCGGAYLDKHNVLLLFP